MTTGDRRGLELSETFGRGAADVRQAMDAMEGAADSLNDETHMELLDTLTP